MENADLKDVYCQVRGWGSGGRGESAGTIFPWEAGHSSITVRTYTIRDWTNLRPDRKFEFELKSEFEQKELTPGQRKG